ncbi:hypothetical protein [Photobacterium kishitanii]|uniref:hypothetical protein n=1 Tax=Photobacterium kishitanii TaxID=318456 RepID=UPI000AB134F9|nr:hypothetical protein [Photobacterium kishitanii]
MKKLILLTILFSSPFSYAGILTFSGSVTAPACKVEIISTQKVTYKNKKRLCAYYKNNREKHL